MKMGLVLPRDWPMQTQETADTVHMSCKHSCARILFIPPTFPPLVLL